MVEIKRESAAHADFGAVLEPKHCFVGEDGFMYCNWIKRKGRIIRPLRKRYLRFPARFKRKGRTHLDSAGSGINPD